MERVVKRYLMHNQGDLEDPKQNDFDEFKLDLQQIKYEIVNDMKKTREDNTRNMFIINSGVQFLAEELLNNYLNSHKDHFKEKNSIENDSPFKKFKEFISSNQIMLRSSFLSDQNETISQKNSLNSSESNFVSNNQIDMTPNLNSKNRPPSTLELIDNLNNHSGKNSISQVSSLLAKTNPSSSTAKVSFDLSENKFFSTPLSKILEESCSESKSDLKTPI